MYNILVVDDSALMRKLMCDIINKIDGYHVADLCADGESAIHYIKQNKYAAVTVNMFMPQVSGVQILKRLKEEGLKVPVIAISSSVKEDRETALKAMELGAVDFVIRPIKMSGDNLNSFSVHLQRSLKIAVSGSALSASEINQLIYSIPDKSAASEEQVPVKKKPANQFDLVAIASSTGGPQALQVLLSMMPGNIGVPVVVVQHMPTGFTASLAERIDNRSKLSVVEAKKGEVMRPNCVYIAPGGRQLKIGEKTKGTYYTNVTTDPPVNNLRPCADVMFESLANLSVERVLCVVLTGMGSDGAKGLSLLKKRKKIRVITQDEKSCVVYGMPKAAFEYGLSDISVDIKEMARVIAKELGVL